MVPSTHGESLGIPEAVSINGGSPKWMDGLFHGTSYKKWMITGAIPILGNLQIDIVYTFIHIISTLKTGW
jgi:hypothetical protein